MDGCATYDDPFQDELDWSFIPDVYGENEMVWTNIPVDLAYRGDYFFDTSGQLQRKVTDTVPEGAITWPGKDRS